MIRAAATAASEGLSLDATSSGSPPADVGEAEEEPLSAAACLLVTTGEVEEDGGVGGSGTDDDSWSGCMIGMSFASSLSTMAARAMEAKVRAELDVACLE